MLGVKFSVMNIRVYIFSALSSCVLWSSSALAQDNPTDAKAKLSKWVETRQIISKEKTDWEVEKQFLESTQTLLEEQAAALEAQVAELKDSTTAADEDRNKLLLERGEFQRADADLAKKIATMEKNVLALVKTFPEPLQKKLEPLVVRIPENPDKTELSLGQRLLSVLGILGQAEKFNSTANFYGETREVGGQKIQVLTLYWGLAFAIYVDSQGEIAGFGEPGPDGWVWKQDNAIAADAKKFMDMYEGNTDVIEFVQLPVSVK